jgi:hypothetical protein
MTKYYDIAKSENTLAENLELAKELEYTHIFMWVNSDKEYTFLAKSLDEAENGAIDLYMSKKEESNREFASEYYSQYIDTYEIQEYLDIVNS